MHQCQAVALSKYRNRCAHVADDLQTCVYDQGKSTEYDKDFRDDKLSIHPGGQALSEDSGCVLGGSAAMSPCPDEDE